MIRLLMEKLMLSRRTALFFFLALLVTPIAARADTIDDSPQCFTTCGWSGPTSTIAAALICSLPRPRAVSPCRFLNGNVWSKPELTCQHVDPQAALAARGEAVLEIKILVFPGSLDDALHKVVQQRGSLK